MRRKRLVVVLAALLALLPSSLVAAQGGGRSVQALPSRTTPLVAEPNDEAEVVAELPAYGAVTITGTDASGAWLQVEAPEGTGYVALEDMIVLNLPLLAPHVVVATGAAGATSLFGSPRLGEDFLTRLPDGTVGTLLGTTGQWAYVSTPAGSGWSVASDWDPLPEGVRLAQVTLRQAEELGVFAAPMIGSEVVATVPDGATIWQLGAAEGQWVEVLTPDGETGYALAVSFAPLPNVLVEAEAGSQMAPAIYAAPDFGAAVLGTVEDGTAVYLLGEADGFWYEVFNPDTGTGYALQRTFSDAYTVAATRYPSAVVRAGPSDAIYNAVAQLPAGTRVLIKGVDESADWLRVAIPWEEVDYGYYGVEGWMATFLFADRDGNTEFDIDLLPVVSE